MEKTYYISREQYLTIKATWAAKHDHTAWQHIIYNILRNKPADYGFIARNKHIQGDNPWFAYNEALATAKNYLSKHNPWTEGSSFERRQKAIASDIAHLKAIFGIDMPEDIYDKLGDKK